jgi:hypothetical protein
MGPNEISKGLLDVICMLLTADAKLPLPQQQVFLAGLAYSGRFDEPVRECLLTAAEVAGDEDEVLLELLHDHLAWRRRAQGEAAG